MTTKGVLKKEWDTSFVFQNTKIIFDAMAIRPLSLKYQISDVGTDLRCDLDFYEECNLLMLNIPNISLYLGAPLLLASSQKIKHERWRAFKQ